MLPKPFRYHRPETLEAALVDGDAERSEAAYRALGASCKACHVAYRNE